jgi:hypothetical protein
MFFIQPLVLLLVPINNKKNLSISVDSPNQTTASSIGPDELPPPYQQEQQGGAPVVTCRVCQALIDITWKKDQHVVKCSQCHEATVSIFFCWFSCNIIKTTFFCSFLLK